MTAVVLPFVPRGTSAHQRLLNRSQTGPAPATACPAPPPAPRRPPDFRLFFASVARADVPPHPMLRVYRVVATAIDWFFRALQAVLVVYLGVGSAVAVPLAIIGRLWWLAAFCAVCASGYAWIALMAIQAGRKRRAATAAGGANV